MTFFSFWERAPLTKTKIQNNFFSEHQSIFEKSHLLLQISSVLNFYTQKKLKNIFENFDVKIKQKKQFQANDIFVGGIRKIDKKKVVDPFNTRIDLVLARARISFKFKHWTHRKK